MHLVMLAIDPGNEFSAYVRYDAASSSLVQFGKLANDELLVRLPKMATDGHLAIEMIASYGMPVGREVFETCVWIGRFVERWNNAHTVVYRRDVKLHLCGQARAKDANVRQALLDRWGGKEVAVGKKAAPGPLYGVSADVWAALGVAVTWCDTRAAR